MIAIQQTNKQTSFQVISINVLFVVKKVLDGIAKQEFTKAREFPTSITVIFHLYS
jgi:hypothetical protein